jgi:uroporphyrinogen decarboxylase
MKRRTFVKTVAASSFAIAAGLGGCSATGGGAPRPAGKRDAFLDVVHGSGKQTYYPGAFFVHFPVEDYFGPTAISRHLDFFRATNMDFLKVQYELKFPVIESLQRPPDWTKVPVFGKDFYEKQLYVIKGIVKEGKKDALVIPTVYAPLSFAAHVTDYKLHISHLNENPEAVRPGLEAITESIRIFVRECAKLGVDGFFQATQGGEANRFVSDQIFTDYIRPCDLAVGEEIAAHSQCHILHIHNGGHGYADYSQFLDYPCDVVNCGFNLADSATSSRQLYEQFRKPIMGGFDRDGVIYSGSPDEIEAEARQILSEAPERFILSATCTVPRDTKWSNIRHAIDTAHAARA